MAKEFFFVRGKGRYDLIQINSVVYAKINNQYISIVTDKKIFRTLATLKDLEKLLPKDRFCKVHRAYIVALNRIKGFDSEKIYLENIEIPIAYNCREQLIASVNILTRNIPARSKARKTVREIQQRRQ